jgi:hypothetical protein
VVTEPPSSDYYIMDLDRASNNYWQIDEGFYADFAHLHIRARHSSI